MVEVIFVQSLSCVWLFMTPWTAAARLSCQSPTPGACWNSCPSSWWYHLTISSSVIPFSSCLQSFPESGSFPMSWLFISEWSKYWSFSFSISPSNKYSGLISFRIGWFDLAVQGNIKNSLAFSLLYGPILTFIHDYWKNKTFDYTDLCWQSDVFAF